MIYQIIEEIVTVSRGYPVTYDIFCMLVIFIVASAYNSFKRININLIGIFLSSILSYSLLYLVWKIRLFGFEYNNDMKIIICILTGFISIEFFTRFNPAVIVGFIIEFIANTALAYLDRYDKKRARNDMKEGVKNGNENQMPKFSEKNISEDEKGKQENKAFSGFQRTK